MDARDAGDLAGGLGHPVVLVDRPSEVEDAHEQEHEDGDGERELDQGLAAIPRPARSIRVHGLTTTFSVSVHGVGTPMVVITRLTV